MNINHRNDIAVQRPYGKKNITNITTIQSTITNNIDAFKPKKHPKKKLRLYQQRIVYGDNLH